MTRQSPTPEKADPAGLAKAVEENKKVADAIQEIADDLAVVHEVLDSDVPKETLTPEVDLAVERTGQLEKQLNESTADLKRVTETLREELSKRSTKG